uniref:Uncharacterized protein n=1 Tax=Rhizophora mucronata TaxID=61149 RepID=A0A2P2P8F3_RHIMU
MRTYAKFLLFCLTSSLIWSILIVLRLLMLMLELPSRLMS